MKQQTKRVRPIKSYENQGDYDVIYRHDRQEESTRGSLNIEPRDGGVMLLLDFKPTEELFRFEQQIEINISAKEARALAYLLLMEANDISEADA